MRKFFTIYGFYIIMLWPILNIYGQTAIISQYIDTDSGTTPKGIEIWNPTATSIDFSTTNLEIQQGTNGGSLTTIRTINSGILPAGGVIVVGTNNMDSAAELPNECSTNVSYNSFTFTFNGNDALALRLDGTITDVFGNPGSDPGSFWSGGGVSTADNNIELKSGITTGDLDGWTNPSDRFQNVSNGSTLTNFGIPPTGCALPIELKSITLIKKNNGSYLNFTTVSETNNSHFNIERSADARNFESIGEIKGAGNSSKEISYAFTDERPLSGINYYRIKQTDYDAQYSYSEIRSVRHKGISNVSITPRTTDGRLDINTELEDYTIAIYNAAGQEVKKMIGMSLDQSISIETLQAGVYFVKINSRSESETVRIVKI